MTLPTLCRTSLAVFCGLHGLVTVAVDLNRTHAANPLWTGHARFHVVVQIASAVMFSMVELALLLGSGPFIEQRFYLAAALAAIPTVGYFIAFAARRLYSGALSDPNGIQPIRTTIFGKSVVIEINIVVEVTGALFLAAVVSLFAHASSTR